MEALVFCMGLVIILFILLIEVSFESRDLVDERLGRIISRLIELEGRISEIEKKTNLIKDKLQIYIERYAEGGE